MEKRMTDKEIIAAKDILDFFDFFNQRAGRELWSDKPREVQEEDIAIFTHKVKVLRDFINRQQAEIERLQKLLDDKCDRCIARDRAEAIKEFVGKIQVEINQMQKNNYATRRERVEEIEDAKIFIGVDTIVQSIDSRIHTLNIIREFINNLAKEMVGEGE